VTTRLKRFPRPKNSGIGAPNAPVILVRSRSPKPGRKLKPPVILHPQYQQQLLQQGSILRNSLSAENLHDKYSSSNFGLF
jgi:hypothetical protein